MKMGDMNNEIIYIGLFSDMSPSAKDLLQIIFDIEDNSIPFEEITLGILAFSYIKVKLQKLTPPCPHVQQNHKCFSMLTHFR